jgi:hypothetical protein
MGEVDVGGVDSDAVDMVRESCLKKAEALQGFSLNFFRHGPSFSASRTIWPMELCDFHWQQCFDKYHVLPCSSLWLSKCMKIRCGASSINKVLSPFKNYISRFSGKVTSNCRCHKRFPKIDERNCALSRSCYESI